MTVVDSSFYYEVVTHLSTEQAHFCLTLEFRGLVVFFFYALFCLVHRAQVVDSSFYYEVITHLSTEQAYCYLISSFLCIIY